MIDQHFAVSVYLTPPPGAFWQWTDRGETISWLDGQTIAFRPELIAVLKRLAPRGLPPLGAVALLLAATRDNWRASSANPDTLIGHLHTSLALQDTETQNELLAKVLGGLDRVNFLDAALRTSLVAKAELADLVFETTKQRTPPQVAEAVVRLLEDGLGEELLVEQQKLGRVSGDGNVWPRELGCLREGLQRVDADALRMRARTGLDAVVEPADVDMEPAERIRALLVELQDDDELAGLARLTRDLMAVASLPRSVSDRDDIPLGGVSDISNRGPLDRLLLSELAHDDLTLAVRVALNEALYLRREAPAHLPPSQRAVLLESGIRSWGVPRVFGTAVALALAATADRHMPVAAWRAKGDGIEPVDLSTRAGLVAHLEALEPEIHPGASLAAFLAVAQEPNHPVESVIVTCDDVLDDYDFQRATQAHGLLPFYAATVNRQGGFRLLGRSVNGSKLLRQATLDLEKLFAAPQKKRTPLVDKDLATELPAILSVDPFPLLLPHPFDSDRCWPVKDYGVLAVTTDRRLMLWTRPGQGAQQLADDLPHTGVVWTSGKIVNGKTLAVVGQLSNSHLHLLEINVERGRVESRKLELGEGKCAGLCQQGGMLLAIFHRMLSDAAGRVAALDMATGKVVQTLNLPAGLRWVRDRFLRNAEAGLWYVLSFDGVKVWLEPLLNEKSKKACPQLLTMFELAGVDGAFAVTREGDIYSTATDSVHNIWHGPARQTMDVRAISADGSKLVLWNLNGAMLLDVDRQTAKPVAGDARLHVEPEIGKLVHPLQLRNRFMSTFIDDDGNLILASRKQAHFGIVYDQNTSRVRLVPRHDAKLGRAQRLPFQPVAESRRGGYTLQVATWPDGRKAYLDSRGLLHLKSADPSRAEVTIVLFERHLSGWTSNGVVWGDRYFLSDRPPEADYFVFKSYIKPFGALLS